MSEHVLIGLAGIVGLGVLAQWLAWRLRLPAILLLLLFGFAAGPWTGLLQPDLIFGDLLFPLVSMAVAIILFEGGLSLRLRDLKQGGTVVFNLASIGLLVTWLGATLGAYLILDLDLPMAILLGIVVVVSGPTVIIPMLRQMRLSGKAGPIVRWEGIVNDPLGAILAVLVFGVILGGSGQGGLGLIVGGALKALFIGGFIGLLGAALLVLLLKRYLISDFLLSPVALMFVATCYVGSNHFQTESGLLAVTVMGIALANQKLVSIHHILEFKENLRVLLIASLFIILAARLPMEAMTDTIGGGWLFVGVLIVVIRPLSAFLCSLGSDLDWRERLFLAWMAPRGIVAAAVASVFAAQLITVHSPGAENLVPITFQVIVGTVAVYGLTSPLLARWLGLSQSNPQGLLIAGALGEEGFAVLLVDSNWNQVTKARSRGLNVHYGNILDEEVLSHLDLDGLGRLLALTSNDEVNSLAAVRMAKVFGRKEIYQPVPITTGTTRRNTQVPKHMRGRYLFGDSITGETISRRFQDGAVIKRTTLTDEFDFEAFGAKYPMAMPMFIIKENREIEVIVVTSKVAPQAGETLVCIVDDPATMNTNT